MVDREPLQTKRSALLIGLTAACGLVLLIAFIAPLHSEFMYPLYPQDEGLLLVYPSLILHGQIPNHAFESVYGVTNLWAVAAAFKVAGYSVTVERSVGVLYRLVIIASLVLLAWRRRGIGAGLSAGVMGIVLFSGTLGLAAFSWMAALAFSSFALLMVDVGLSRGMKRAPVALAGLGFGLAVGARIDIGLSVVVVLVILIAAERKSLRWLAPGLALGFVPLAVNIAQAGLPAVVRDQVTQPIFTSGPSRRLPLSTLTHQELALLFLCVAVAVASVVVGGVQSKRHGGWNALFLLILGVFEIGILPQAFQRSDSYHLALVSCFVLPAAVMLPPWVVRARSVPMSFNLFPVVFGILVLVLAQPYFGRIYWDATGFTSDELPVYQVANDGRSVPVSSAADQAGLTALLKQVDARSRPGQRIFVGPLDLRTANYNDTFIYFLLPSLQPGSYYLEMNPGIANGDHSQLTADLRKDDLLILSNRYDNAFDPESSTRLGPASPNALVQSDFRPIDTEGPWTLYARRQGT